MDPILPLFLLLYHLTFLSQRDNSWNMKNAFQSLQKNHSRKSNSFFHRVLRIQKEDLQGAVPFRTTAFSSAIEVAVDWRCAGKVHDINVDTDVQQSHIEEFRLPLHFASEYLQSFALRSGHR